MAFKPLRRLYLFAEVISELFFFTYGHIVVRVKPLLIGKSPYDPSQAGFAHAYGILSSYFASNEADSAVPSLVASCHGTVLEIGPGTGNQVLRYDKSKVTRIIGVEPNLALHPYLRKAIKKAGLQDIYQIVGCGVQDVTTLESVGVTKDSVDCILSIQVLCSVPKPVMGAACKAMYDALKPGGAFLFYEHVESNDLLARFGQWALNWVWPAVTGACQLGRRTTDSLLKAGKWERIEVRREGFEEGMFPKDTGKLIKAL